jgi:hypothetical protein
MADYFYAVARGKGARPQDVVVGTSTASSDVELHVSTTNSVTRKDVLIAIEAIKNFILSNGVGTTTGPGVDLPVN